MYLYPHPSPVVAPHSHRARPVVPDSCLLHECRQDTTNTHFVLFEFAVDQTQGREKRSHDSNGDKGEIADTPVRLKACKYKKR